MDDLIGRRFKDYRIDSELGRGGMAIVYLAEQSIGLDIRKVALKILPRHFLKSQDDKALNARKRFDNELSISRMLQHPQVLRYYDHGTLDGMPYIVTQYMLGGTLADMLAEYEQLDPQLTLHYVMQIAAGLDYIHTKDVIHQDIKPRNMLLSEQQDNLVISDFGISRRVSDSHERMIGSRPYMAPERFSRGPITPAVDIYGLGITTYELLVGDTPFGRDESQQMYRHLNERIPSIHDRQPDIPPQVDKVLEKALAKEPKHRYQTATQFTEALKDAIDTPYSPSIPPPPERRQPRLLLILVAALVLVVSILGVGFAFWGRQEDESTANNMNVAESATSTATLEIATTEAPNEAAITTEITTTPTPTEEPIIPLFGGGSGVLGFNAAGSGYRADVDCLINERQDCLPVPEVMQSSTFDPRLETWSPDGNWLAFSANGGYLFVASQDEDDPLQISKNASVDPSWSSDGSQLAYAMSDTSRSDIYNIWVLDTACLNSGNPTCLEESKALTSLTGYEHAPQWSPDNSTLAFLQEQTSTLDEIFIVSSDGGQPVQLSRAGYNATNQRWLTDSSGLLFIESFSTSGQQPSTYFWDSTLSYIPRSGGDPVDLLQITLGDYFFGEQGLGMFEISPDGETVIISMVSNGIEDLELYLLDLSCLAAPDTCADNLIQLTDNIVDDLFPIWSPDGSTVAYLRGRNTRTGDIHELSARNSSADIFVMDIQRALDGSGEAAVTQATTLGFVDIAQPVWQPALE